jgi:hypothetical protein
MKYFKITKQIAALGLAALLFSSCDKVETTAPLGTAGQTLVTILEGGSPAAIIKDPVDFVATPFTLTKGVIDIRREVPNATELNKKMTVIVKDDTAAVHAANPAYVVLPSAFYTLTLSPGITKTGGSGGIFTVVMQPGEFGKQIYINIPDATVLDPSTLYGLGFTITTVDAGGKISSAKSVVVEIGAKNAYDGVYSVVSGLVTRYTAPNVPANDALSGQLAGNPDVYLITIGANSVTIPPSGNAGGLYWAVGNNSMVAGIDGVKVTVDPSTKLTSALSSGYGSNSNATFGNWAGHPNYYDPATKTFYFAWRWNPTANVREYEVVLKYKGPR